MNHKTNEHAGKGGHTVDNDGAFELA
eukprot:COSAG02_NODE_44408_length_366_cov_1.112360_1_plen_25_part_10